MKRKVEAPLDKPKEEGPIFQRTSVHIRNTHDILLHFVPVDGHIAHLMSGLKTIE